MKRWVISIGATAPIIAGLIFFTLTGPNPFQSPISPISPISPPATPTPKVSLTPTHTPRQLPPYTATPGVHIHEWYDDCPQPGPCEPQPTYTPNPMPTCRPVQPCEQTPYPTYTPYPPQPL